MRFFALAILLAIFVAPLEVFSQGVSNVTTDDSSYQLVSYYDLRDRETLVQVSNISQEQVIIHVQIFRNDIPGCPEINFYDELTPSDTHIYDLRNIDGNLSPVNITLEDDSNGIVVITHVESVGGPADFSSPGTLIGNFRIIDLPGNYEYRTNSAGHDFGSAVPPARYTINFNQIGGNNFADIVGVEIDRSGPGFTGVDLGDLDTFAFVYSDAETPTSCDFFVFACGGEVESDNDPLSGEGDFLNVGINDEFPSSKGDRTICPGNTNSNGIVELLNDEENSNTSEFRDLIVGFAGLNNGDGTGSMDSWVSNPANDICQFIPNSDQFGQCDDFMN